MLRLEIPAREMYDERNGEFITIESQVLELEHSLVALSEWESKWCKPFISKEPKTQEETLDYIKCMTLTPNVDPLVYTFLSNEHIEQINKYMEAPMTATTFSNTGKGRSSSEYITNELIYYWMTALTIPFDPCETWHLNRLLTLVQVCNLKNQPPKKMSRRAVMNQNAMLNEARRAQYNAKG